MADELLTMGVFDKVVVANRGAVAARVIRALGELGIRSVAVHSDADADAPYLEMADEVFHLGPSAPAASYLDQDAVLEVARRSGADGLHPGYGFLAEHSGFARRVVDRGIGWIGPSPEWIETMGHKTRARAFVADHGLPVGHGSGVVAADDPDTLLAAAETVGFPLLVKPAGGGGGIGMIAVTDPSGLLAAVERASSMAERGFSEAGVYLERLLLRPRHVEYQLLADRHGAATHLFERDCSVQRRHQKIIEEAPAPGIDRATLDDFADRVASMMRRVGYDNIGTVETLHTDEGSTFLEMNTRLQVEHGVTEEVTGVDLVAAQIRLAAGERLTTVLPDPVTLRGHAIEARVYAEDPVRFFPSPGRLETFQPPDGIRVETGYRRGQEVTPFYDPLLAKVIARGETRAEAVDTLVAALEDFGIVGVKHTIPALVAILRSEEFAEGHVHTGLAHEVVSRNRERTLR